MKKYRLNCEKLENDYGCVRVVTLHSSYHDILSDVAVRHDEMFMDKAIGTTHMIVYMDKDFKIVFTKDYIINLFDEKLEKVIDE